MLNRRTLLQLISTIPFVGLLVPSAPKSVASKDRLSMSFQLMYDDLLRMLQTKNIQAERIEIIPVLGECVEVRLYGSEVRVGMATCDDLLEAERKIWFSKEMVDDSILKLDTALKRVTVDFNVERKVFPFPFPEELTR